MTRVLSAIVLVALVGSVLWWGTWWAVLVLAMVVAAVAASEMATLSGAVGAPVPVPVLIVSTMAVCAAVPVGFGSGDAVVVTLLALIVVSGLSTLAAGQPAPAMVTRAALMSMAPVYIGLPLGALVWMHVLFGPRVVIFLIVTIAVSDSLQYFTGRAFGRTKLAPAVSPAKTVEGAIGGLIGAAIVGTVLGPVWGKVGTLFDGFALAVVLAMAGIAGDLFESLLKRSAGVKDSSALIPGHGGVLDRVDAYLFATPLYALFLRYLG